MTYYTPSCGAGGFLADIVGNQPWRADMTPPTIADAKQLANKGRLRGVLILSFGGGRFAATSYGHTRKDCDAMRSVNEQIARLIETGVIVLPEEFGEERCPRR